MRGRDLSRVKLEPTLEVWETGSTGGHVTTSSDLASLINRNKKYLTMKFPGIHIEIDQKNSQLV